MDSFKFSTTPFVICAPGALDDLVASLPMNAGNRILVITDTTLLSLGLLDPFFKTLEAANIEFAIFDNVVADPPLCVVEAAVSIGRSFCATAVIGIGGGSPMDVAKVTALVLGCDCTVDEIFVKDDSNARRLPLILVPTTAGTGSEVTPIAILTTGAAQKRGVVLRALLPDLAVLDARLTMGLPSTVTAATGIDAMVHAIEAYTSASPLNNPISKSLARQALQILSQNIRQATFSGEDQNARQSMLLGSLLAGQAFANSPVGAVHALAYPIGARFHVPHGLSNALVLTAVLRFNMEAAATDYTLISTDVFPELYSRPIEQRAEEFVEMLESLIKDLQVPTTLREVGISEDDLPLLVSDAMQQTRLLVNNPRKLSELQILEIYRQAL